MTHFLKQLIRPLSVLSLAALMTMSPLAVAASQEPDVLLRDTVEGLTTKIDSRESYYKDNINELEGLVDTALKPVVDYRYIAASVMGKYFKVASPKQRTEFSKVFHDTLISTYAKGLVSFDYAKLEVKDSEGDRRYEDQDTVYMDVIDTKGKVYPVAYSMRLRNDEWKVVNVIVNGVNLGLTFRNQFDQAMRDNGRDIDAVINGWQPDVDLDKTAAEDKGNSNS